MDSWNCKENPQVVQALHSIESYEISKSSPSDTVLPSRLYHISKQHSQLKTNYSILEQLGDMYYSNHNNIFQILLSIWRLEMLGTCNIWKRNYSLWMEPAQESSQVNWACKTKCYECPRCKNVSWVIERHAVEALFATLAFCLICAP